MNGSSSNVGTTSKPKTTSASIDDKFKGHAVERSKELLACAKTAWKIQERSILKQQQLQQQQNPNQPKPPPLQRPTFRLSDTSIALPQLTIVEDGFALLRAMEFALKQLQILVRRRGQTNDPTEEIAAYTKQLEQDTNELTEFCRLLLAKRRISRQQKKHWEYVVQWYQQVAQHYGKQLADCLKLRGEVLADQAQQRKKIISSVSTGGASSFASTKKTATPLFDSPLFTAPSKPKQRNPPPPPPPHPSQSQKPASNTNGTNGRATAVNGNASTATNTYPTQQQQQANPYSRNTAASNSSSRYYQNTSGGGYGGGGYGGGTAASGYYGSSDGYDYGSSVGGTATSMGMRQRKGGPGGGMTSVVTSDYDPYADQNADDHDDHKVHNQIQERQNKRKTQQRLDEAQQAETKLSELGQLFSKMGSLISQQGEQLEKIEDDVETAHTEVLAGQEELTKLYGIKKGNRPLIIKTFLILNFLIVFMRAYKK